jgi:hypothetical protein
LGARTGLVTVDCFSVRLVCIVSPGKTDAS